MLHLVPDVVVLEAEHIRQRLRGTEDRLPGEMRHRAARILSDDACGSVPEESRPSPPCYWLTGASGGDFLRKVKTSDSQPPPSARLGQAHRR